MLEVEPASLGQVMRGRGGRLVWIEDDVSNVAKDLRDIHPDLRLAYNERGEYFVVYQKTPSGEHLVTTARECDQRLVSRVRKVVSPSYDPIADADAAERKAKRDLDHRLVEGVGEVGERLAHAIRTDLRKAQPGPVYIPADISPTPSRIVVPRDI